MSSNKLVIICDTSFILDAFLGCKDKGLEFASKFIMKLIENQNFNKIRVVIPSRVQDELFKVYRKNKSIQNTIKGLFEVIEEKKIIKYEKDGFGYGDSGCADIANFFSKSNKPVILTNDIPFIKKYSKDRIIQIVDAKKFFRYILIDAVCFRNCEKRSL